MKKKRLLAMIIDFAIIINNIDKSSVYIYEFY